MDKITNPFTPDAGSQPPTLTGRDNIIEDLEVAIKRIVSGRHANSHIFTGLRGTGKTVLLVKAKNMAISENCYTSPIELSEHQSLKDILNHEISNILRTLFPMKTKTKTAIAKFISFAKSRSYKISDGINSLSIDPYIGDTDSGDLEKDLPNLFVSLGEALQETNKAWILFIDEMQYLDKKELSALIVALHKTRQEGLPILLFGAGLPQLQAFLGDIKSYTERLFDYTQIGTLDKDASYRAVREPIKQEGKTIDDAALNEIYKTTSGYPYFLQVWGKQAWDIAKKSPIKKSDIKNATKLATQHLDNSFFKSREIQLTNSERDYVFAMASLDKKPYKTSEIAKIQNKKIGQLSTIRENIISKGVIYSPEHGVVDFTVPMFDDYLRRMKKAGRTDI